MVQNTFIYLARRMPKFRYDRSRGSFKSWLCRVTRSRISDFCRRAESKELALPGLGLEEDDANVWESVPDPAGQALDEARVPYDRVLLLSRDETIEPTASMQRATRVAPPAFILIVNSL